MLGGIREFKNFYKSLVVGDSFYLNALGVKKNVIDYVRTLIQTGRITPIKEEVEKIFTQDCHDRIYNGEIIAPSITYKKIKA